MKDRNNEKMYPHPYYPIGSIFLSVNNTNPSKWFSGTWELISQGRTLVGVDTNDTDFNTVKKTGGHKINPNLNCCMASYGFAVSGGYSDRTIVRSPAISSSHEEISAQISNLQPYFTCYIWCRIA